MAVSDLNITSSESGSVSGGNTQRKETHLVSTGASTQPGQHGQTVSAEQVCRLHCVSYSFLTSMSAARCLVKVKVKFGTPYILYLCHRPGVAGAYKYTSTLSA